LSRPAAVVLATTLLLVLAPVLAGVAVVLLGLAGPPPVVLRGLLGEAADAARVGLGSAAALGAPASVLAAVGVWQLRPIARAGAVVLLFGIAAGCAAVTASGDTDHGVGAALAIGLLAGSALAGLLTAPAAAAFGVPPEPVQSLPPLEPVTEPGPPAGPRSPEGPDATEDATPRP
jgi:xanthine/uracil permease